jgi:hypothetical protein
MIEHRWNPIFLPIFAVAESPFYFSYICTRWIHSSGASLRMGSSHRWLLWQMPHSVCDTVIHIKLSTSAGEKRASLESQLHRKM